MLKTDGICFQRTMEKSIIERNTQVFWSTRGSFWSCGLLIELSPAGVEAGHSYERDTSRFSAFASAPKDIKNKIFGPYWKQRHQENELIAISSNRTTPPYCRCLWKVYRAYDRIQRLTPNTVFLPIPPTLKFAGSSSVAFIKPFTCYSCKLSKVPSYTLQSKT